MKEKKIDNFTIFIFDEVYDPADDSLLLADNLAVNPGDLVIEVGSGCGIISIVAAAKGGKRVVAIDVSPPAARNTLYNVRVNGMEGVIDVLVADLLNAIKPEEMFDVVLFNPPYLPVEEDGILEASWSGGKTGREVIERFIENVRNYIKFDGRCQIVLSSLMKPQTVIRKLKKIGFKAELVAEKRFFFEKICVVTFHRSASSCPPDQGGDRLHPLTPL
nr:methyltransferase domain-containing protein [Candidatus Bathyarchaeota archaeon]